MSRIAPIDPQTATGRRRELLDQVQKMLGSTPNFLRVFAQSPAALAGFLGLHGALLRGSLDAATRERIALLAAESNGCAYCVAAHTAGARQTGLSDAEILAARQGGSSEERAAAAVRFAQAVLEHTGDVSGAELRAVREAGFSEGDIVEIVTHVALNTLTNTLARVGQIDIDYPEVALLAKAGAQT